jgi:hypothetical protein
MLVFRQKSANVSFSYDELIWYLINSRDTIGGFGRETSCVRRMAAATKVTFHNHIPIVIIKSNGT